MSKILRLWGKAMAGFGLVIEAENDGVVNGSWRLLKSALFRVIRRFFRFMGVGISKETPAPRPSLWIVFSLTMVGVMVLITGLLSDVILKRQREKLYNHVMNRGMVSIDYFVRHAKIPLFEDNSLALNTLIKNTQGVGGYLYAAIVDREGVVKAHTNPSEMGHIMVFSSVGGAISRGEVTSFTHDGGTLGSVLTMRAPVFFKETHIGTVYVGLSIDFIHGFLREVRHFFLLGMGLFSLSGLGVVLFFRRRFPRPMSNLEVSTQACATGHRSQGGDFSSGDERPHWATVSNDTDKGESKEPSMRETLGTYVGVEVLNLILRNPESIWLKGRKSEATVLFADIRGFTAYTEMHAPEVLVEDLNHYFDIATATILKHGGYVDKFIGDAVLAVFGVPVYDEDHFLRCVRAAVEMQNALRTASERGGNPLLSRVGISIKSGVVVAGSIGSQAKMEYTVIGDTVNIAAHINGLAGGGEIVVGRSMMDAHGDILEGEPLAPQKIKGRSGLVDVYRLTGLRGEAY